MASRNRAAATGPTAHLLNGPVVPLQCVVWQLARRTPVSNLNRPAAINDAQACIPAELLLLRLLAVGGSSRRRRASTGVLMQVPADHNTRKALQDEKHENSSCVLESHYVLCCTALYIEVLPLSQTHMRITNNKVNFVNNAPLLSYRSRIVSYILCIFLLTKRDSKVLSPFCPWKLCIYSKC